MGVTQRLGTIPLAIQTDSSNNVGIGGAANASYKLAVTGASLFSSTLTANGLVSANAKLEVNDANGIPIRFQDISAAITSQTAGYIGMSTSAFSGNNGDLVLYPRTSATSRILLMGGNVGIGTSSPQSLLDVKGATPFIRITDSSVTGETGLIMDAGGGFIRGALTINYGTGEFKISVGSAGNSYYQTFLVNGSERMRITTDGRLCLNTTAPIAAGRFNIVDDCNSTTPIEIKDTAASNSGAYLVRFVNNSGTVCGSIAHQTSTTVQYNTSSDYRLKTDLKDYNGLDVVSKIKTYDFEWIEDGKRMYGVLAHELAEIIPYAVNGEKDGEQMQGADYSKIVPVLVKAIQELSQKVTALENK